MKKKILVLVMSMVIAAGVLGGCGNNQKGNVSGNQNKGVSESQNKSQSNDIGEKKAKEIAIAHSGVEQKNLSKLKLSKEKDEFKEVYDIEFVDHANGMEYDYEILASDGSIYAVESEKFNQVSEITKEIAAKMKITHEEAAKLALDRVSGATMTDLYMHLEHVNGSYVYDGEIVYDQKEYDFEIDANTGEFLEWREERI